MNNKPNILNIKDEFKGQPFAFETARYIICSYSKPITKLL